MKSLGAALWGVGTISTLMAVGCDRENYATKGELDSLRAQLVATHDTMVALWTATRQMNIIEKDTTPPPVCPPRCLELIVPPVPARLAPGSR
jgi:hypothetical protein